MRPTDPDGGRRSRPALWAAALSLLLHLPPERAAHADTAPACGAVGANQAPLLVSVSGMRSGRGNITITIYPDEPSHFLDGAYKVARQEVAVTLPVTSACFALPAPGYYAVALFHDENDDHHLNTNALGIPTEGYGFSNNPTLYFGPPHPRQGPVFPACRRQSGRDPDEVLLMPRPRLPLSRIGEYAQRLQARAGQNAIYQAGATAGADIMRLQDRRRDTASMSDREDLILAIHLAATGGALP